MSRSFLEGELVAVVDEDQPHGRAVGVITGVRSNRWTTKYIVRCSKLEYTVSAFSLIPLLTTGR